MAREEIVADRARDRAGRVDPPPGPVLGELQIARRIEVEPGENVVAAAIVPVDDVAMPEMEHPAVEMIGVADEARGGARTGRGRWRWW